ncbi:hypothetical protein [Mycolicibacterium fortuitum]|uniref:hypothetical protein n=1 Tax=Mycolicibacterium fortuitum TaxID=1766 RepID=UPI001CE12EF1|nr:hypothetical protein [Mycolicibacterium fortuitum]MCA4727429.1 hypothetical protein [Mycolicibacterium fortuitum]
MSRQRVNTWFVTRVELSTGRTPPDDPDGQPFWRVSWTWYINGRPTDRKQLHCSEAAAYRHIRNLLKDRQPGVSAEDICNADTISAATL